ncbi:MAG: GTP-binding protein, partial [Atopobiaceae bacterium]|nr:GTP-binding protein [Atopobiaceae bacterium]
AMERQHKGVLTGAPIDDMWITLVSARTHLKHTEGGDIRQATYRAIRQALMRAKERGETRVIEPWYRFSLEIPQENVGRALADLTRMMARVEPPMMHGATAVLEGTVPASELGDYTLDVAAYTKGLGRLSVVFAGYEPCHDEQVVIARAAYVPEIDLPHTPDSIFCSHGAGYTVRWNRVEETMHIVDDPTRRRPWRAADASFFSK